MGDRVDHLDALTNVPWVSGSGGLPVSNFN